MGNSGTNDMKVFLDYHSTTPVDQRVMDEMYPFFMDKYANASSLHCFGEETLEAVELARERVAALINAEPEQIYFTSGATEANNIAILGKLRRDDSDEPLIVTTPVEHSSVLATIEAAVAGYEMAEAKYLSVQQDGNIDPQELRNILQNNTVNIVSVMMANNEVGTIYDIKKLADICKRFGVYFHTDATQAVGKIPVNVKELDIDALSLSAHKIYGPKGIGALYLKNHMDIVPIIHGGYQNTVTSGTLNVPGIVGFGKACELLSLDEQAAESERLSLLRNYLLDGLSKNIDQLTVNGTMDNRLCNNLNVSICDVPAEAIIMGMDDVIVSGGSACKSGDHKPSHVLLAMGVKYPKCAIRFGLGRWTTLEEIEYAVQRITEVAKGLRSKK